MPASGGLQSAQSNFINDATEFDAALSLLRVAQWQYDPAHNELTWQRSFVSGAGGDQQHSTEPMDTVLERYSPDDRPQLLKHFEIALKEGAAGPSRFTVFTRQGERTFIESAGVRVVGPDGHSVVRGVYRNCASDVGTESSLREFTVLLGKMATSSHSAIILIDQQGSVRSVNAQFCKVFKLPAEHGLVGRNIRNVPNRLGKGLVSTLISLLELGSHDVHAQKRFILPSGVELMLSYRVFYFGSGSRSGGLLFKADVDHSADMDMGALFDHLPTPMVAIHLQDRHVVAANAMARRFFGLRKEHIMVEDITSRILNPPDLRAMMETISSLGIENGHVCQVKSLLGDSQTYRLRALPYTDNERRLLILEFHPSKKAKSANGAGQPEVHRNGLLKRVVKHLDF